MSLGRRIFIAALLTSTPTLALAQAEPEAPPRPDDLPAAEEPVEAMSEIEFYARDYGVSSDEAERRFEVVREAGQFAASLRENQPETFAGLEIVHQPQFRVVVRFTSDADNRLSALGLSDDFVAELADESENARRQRQAAVGNAMRAAGIRYQSALRPDGSIDLFVEQGDAAKVQGVLLAAGITQPNLIRTKALERIEEPGVDFGQVQIIGGDLVYGYEGSCSAGFTVHESGSTSTRYILTAGHCENDLWHDSVYLPFVGERAPQIGQPYDFQWHSRGEHDPLTNTVKNGSTATLEITSIYPPAYMAPGEYL